MAEKKCLIVVDMQYDFLNGGSLCVNGGNDLIPGINNLKSTGGFDLVVFTQDWHPSDHVSFHTTQNCEPFTLIDKKMAWPVHCVNNTKGAEVHSDIVVDKDNDVFIKKGIHKEFECYSGFADDGGNSTGLKELLIERGIKKVYVCGVATDYCVSATCRDSNRDFETYLVTNCIASVDPSSTEPLYAQLKLEGIKLILIS